MLCIIFVNSKTYYILKDVNKALQFFHDSENNDKIMLFLICHFLEYSTSYIMIFKHMTSKMLSSSLVCKVLMLELLCRWNHAVGWPTPRTGTHRYTHGKTYIYIFFYFFCGSRQCQQFCFRFSLDPYHFGQSGSRK